MLEEFMKVKSMGYEAPNSIVELLGMRDIVSSGCDISSGMPDEEAMRNYIEYMPKIATRVSISFVFGKKLERHLVSLILKDVEEDTFISDGIKVCILQSTPGNFSLTIDKFPGFIFDRTLRVVETPYLKQDEEGWVLKEPLRMYKYSIVSFTNVSVTVEKDNKSYLLHMLSAGFF